MIAGLAAWPFAETTLLYHQDFSTYLVFNIFLGIVFGLVMGVFFGSSDGILSSITHHLIRGVMHGALLGAVGGMIGCIVSQGILFLVGNVIIHSTKDMNLIGFPISRAIGWAVLGIFIGLVDGVRSGSWNKMKVGILGGISGGFLGGLVLEYLRLIMPNIVFARMFGLILFGLFIGFFYGLVESQLSFGTLRILNGRNKGKEFLINQRRMRLGFTKKNDIVLNEYSNIADQHAELRCKKNEVIIKNINKRKPLIVNDDKVSEHHLKFEDVIQIGNAKLFYKYQ
jgi:hypothetical protein